MRKLRNDKFVQLRCKQSKKNGKKAVPNELICIILTKHVCIWFLYFLTLIGPSLCLGYWGERRLDAGHCGARPVDQYKEGLGPEVASPRGSGHPPLGQCSQGDYVDEVQHCGGEPDIFLLPVLPAGSQTPWKVALFFFTGLCALNGRLHAFINWQRCTY